MKIIRKFNLVSIASIGGISSVDRDTQADRFLKAVSECPAAITFSLQEI
jgi:hypothetical protein